MNKTKTCGHPPTNPISIVVRNAWRLIVAIVGGTILLFGLVMIFTPGPAMVVIPLGLAILAVEFVWAKRLLRRIRVTAKWKLRKQRNTLRESVGIGKREGHKRNVRDTTTR